MPLTARLQRQQARRALKRRVNSMLRHVCYMLRHVRRPTSIVEPCRVSDVQRILVCRINRRLGNTLFLTPLLNALESTFPRATVDVVLGDETLAPLLSNRHNIGRVFGIAPWSWAEVPRLYRLGRHLRSVSYDLVIDPCHNSSSGRLVSVLANTSHRVGFQTPDQWLPLTDPVPQSHQPGHAARVPLALARIFATAETPPFNDVLDIRLSTEELRAGRRALSLRAEGAGLSGLKLIGFFVEARDGKRLSDAWWIEFVQAIRSRSRGIGLLQLVAPGTPGSFPGVPSIECPSARGLGAVLAGLDLFVSGDTGPMHLASAAGVPTIGLFTVTSPASYGPIGIDDASLSVLGVAPALVAERVLQHLDMFSPGGPRRLASCRDRPGPEPTGPTQDGPMPWRTISARL